MRSLLEAFFLLQCSFGGISPATVFLYNGFVVTQEEIGSGTITYVRDYE
jgi:hypothetical protein